MRAWGHVRTFTPWPWITDATAERLLAATGWERPATPVPPTGHELVEHYLEPLTALLGDAVRLGARVVAVSRDGMDKTRTVGRAARPFLLRVRDTSGAVSELRARAVVDATGTWEHRNPLGAAGLRDRGPQRGRLAQPLGPQLQPHERLEGLLGGTAGGPAAPDGLAQLDRRRQGAAGGGVDDGCQVRRVPWRGQAHAVPDGVVLGDGQQVGDVRPGERLEPDAVPLEDDRLWPAHS